MNGSGTASLITGSDRETVHRDYISGTELQRGGAADAMDSVVDRRNNVTVKVVGVISRLADYMGPSTLPAEAEPKSSLSAIHSTILSG